MRRMTKIATLMFGLLLLYGTAAAGSNDLGQIRATIERSSLPREGKVLLLKRATDAVRAGVPSPDVAVIVDRGLARKTDGKELGEYLGEAVKAKEKGLPVRPVLDRIEQGLSKGVPPARISAATRRFVVNLSTADQLVDSLAGKAGRQQGKAAAVPAVARALERSVPEETIRQIGRKSISGGASLSRFGAAVDTMTFFVESGMSVDQARGMIDKAIGKGYSENEMFMMQKDMSDMMRRNSNMNEVMRNMDMMMDRGSMGGGMGGGSMPPGAPGMGGAGGGGMSGGGMGGGGMSGGGMGMGGHRR